MQAYLPPCLLFTPALLPPVHTCPPNPHSHLPTFLLFTPAHSLPVYTCPPAFCSHLPFCLLFTPTCPPSSCSYLSTYLLFTPALLSPIHTCPHASCSNFLSPFVNFHLSSLVVFRKFWCSDCLLLLLHSISTITRAWTLMPTETGRMLPQRFYEVSVRTKLVSHVLQFSSDCFNSFLACQETCKLCLLRQSPHSKISVLTIAEALSLLVMAR